MVIDPSLPEDSGWKLIEQISTEPDLRYLPIVVYADGDLGSEEQAKLKQLAQTAVIKQAPTLETLLNETTLFLHRVEATLPEPKREMLQRIREADLSLAGKTVLIVEDDVRNTFALTSLMERYMIQVLYAENGRQGIKILKGAHKVDLVFMDMMMPQMDGYETIRSIRQIESFKSLPIIALTARAMQGDREKCIQAGASDYVAKPADTDHLLALLRMWLNR